MVGGEGGLIGVVEMTVGENHDATRPAQPGDHNRLMSASCMLSHHGMQQHVSSILAGRPRVKQHSGYKWYHKAQGGFRTQDLQN